MGPGQLPGAVALVDVGPLPQAQAVASVDVGQVMQAEALADAGPVSVNVADHPPEAVSADDAKDYGSYHDHADELHLVPQGNHPLHSH